MLGAGRIIHYAFLPGLSYYRATADPAIADRLNAGSGMRELVADALIAADVTLPVTVNRSLVEAPALYSDKGVAVTLLNYGVEKQDAELKEIEVTVTVDKPVQRVKSSVTVTSIPAERQSSGREFAFGQCRCVAVILLIRSLKLTEGISR